MEEYLQGYCRTIDAARLVSVESDAQGVQIDCDYHICAYAAECPIGKQITALLRGEGMR